MNAFDTEIIESLLAGKGIVAVEDPAEADIIIVNTCSIREHAEQRAIGRLNDLSRHEGAILVICGCMAQRLGQKLFSLVPGASLVVGPDNYQGLPEAIAACLEGGNGMADTKQDPDAAYRLETLRGDRVSRFLAITRGCGNFCSYCIVPYLRGPVRSRAADQIIEETRMMSGKGTREVTLLGQNVMAYRHGSTDFATLLKRILNETRGYTKEDYVDIVKRGKQIKPDLALSTDFIVGFPTETDAEFEETVEMVEKCGFDYAFSFKYSPRSGTVSALMKDDVPDQLKKERLQILNDAIKKVRKSVLEKQVGTRDEILLDAEVKKGEYRLWRGRTPHFRNVTVTGADLKPGDIIDVTLSKIDNFTFAGEDFSRR
ncbi:MAG: radical SAM protein [Candidatus Krumholzibacteria bacterium]|nr:radical SAM protein [Candidatus Krumholzibacteria bacterium]